jgi:hypothetical protein
MPGLLRGVARTAVVAGTATAVSNRVSRRQSDRWASQDEASYAEEAPPAPAAPAEAGESRIVQLKELGQLREQGVLNDAEFEAEKARILG